MHPRLVGTHLASPDPFHDMLQNLARALVRRPREHLHADVCADAVDVLLRQLALERRVDVRVDDGRDVCVDDWRGVSSSAFFKK